jgi:predicted LPLAT superfamily acyltransferase
MNAPATSSAAARTADTAEWRRNPERGSRALLRAMAYLSLRLGRPAGRIVLYGIAGYFFLFAPKARSCMRSYLRRVLAREPRAGDRLRLIMNFATSIHDRLYLLAGRYQLFDVSQQGEELMQRIVADGSGAVLLGAHVGSFEVLRWIGERQPNLSVTITMYEQNARKLNEILATVAPNNPPDVIAVGHLDAMLQIRERLDRGALVGMLADRSFGDEATLPVTFLGATAYLPIAPMRAAAMLGQRVIFMLGLYRGGNRYHVVFEPLADFRSTPRAQRQAAIEAAITRYAALLEQYCRSDPYNWFNFFDFWHSPTRIARATVE